jgi:hypothetical protein
MTEKKGRPEKRSKKKRIVYIAINNDGDESIVGSKQEIQREIESWLIEYSSDSEEQEEYYEQNIKTFTADEIKPDLKFIPVVLIHERK